MTTVQTISLSQDSPDTIAAHIAELVTLAQHLSDVQTASGGMSAILAAPGAAQAAEAYKRDCARYESLCRQLYQDTQGVVSLGPATAEKLGLIKPGATMSIGLDGTLDVRQLVFALGTRWLR